MGSNEEKKEKKFIPGLILDDEEEIFYELTGNGCSRCPLRGLCG